MQYVFHTACRLTPNMHFVVAVMKELCNTVYPMLKHLQSCLRNTLCCMWHTALVVRLVDPMMLVAAMTPAVLVQAPIEILADSPCDDLYAASLPSKQPQRCFGIAGVSTAITSKP